jgi:CRP/FNR family cyclic AMP-dependent transcriptional regulator
VEFITRQALKSVPLFSHLPEEYLGTLEARVALLRQPARKLMLRAVAESDALYVILSGRAKVFVNGEDGREAILSVLGPRDYFGEMGLIDDQPRSASVETIEPCNVVRLLKADFLQCMQTNRELAMRIMRGLAMRLRGANRQIESLALMDTYGRVSRLLLDLAEEINGKLRIPMKLSRKEIAAMVGASREVVSRVMNELINSGYIAIDRQGMVLRDGPPSRRGTPRAWLASAPMNGREA